MQKVFVHKVAQITGLSILTLLLAAVGLFFSYKNPFVKKENVAATKTVVAQTDTRLEDGSPCDAAPVDGDINQGRRLHLSYPYIAPGDYIKIDVAKEFNEKCMNSILKVPYGGFSDGTVEFDVDGLINTFDAMERGNTTSSLGTEHSEFALYDNDITPANSTPYSIEDFPSSCNVIFLRKQEGFRDNTVRYEDRLNYGSYCCQNGWGTEEYLTNPNDSKDISTDPSATFEPGEAVTNNRIPEPDTDGDPRNGYNGSMSAHYTIQWTRTTKRIDVTQEEIPSTTVSVAFKYSIPWPGLLFQRLTIAGGGDINYYRSKVVGNFEDAQKGNGQWDAAPSSSCDGSQSEVLPWTPPSGESDWVIPVAHPCPPATPKTDKDGDYAWGHDEPFRDTNHNGEYDCPDPSDSATCEEFEDMGNGYGGAGDTWTATAPSLGGTVDPELVFNRQFMEIAGSPRVGTVARAVHMIWYPVRNVEVRGLFEQYTQTQCPCRPDDGVKPEEDFEGFIPCQAVFQDVFNPEQCGVCGANQPILNGGPSAYPQNAYCEDTLPRTTQFRWPPFNLNVYGLRWDVSSGQISQLFDSVLKDVTKPPSVSITLTPESPKKGDSVRVAANAENFAGYPQDNYFSWTINDYSQQGLVAGATERVPKHLAPPDYVEIDPETKLPITHKETRTFFFAPERVPSSDTDNDGLDDNWERRYFGSLSPNPWDDTDNDGRTAKDYASVRIDKIPADAPPANPDGTPATLTKTYKDNGRYIQIVPGVWLVSGNGTKQFIAPENFNPDWVKRPTKYTGFTNAEEYVWGTNPIDPDTDDDGYADGVDILGIGQAQWDYINPHNATDADRDKIGVMTLGNAAQASEKDQVPLSQLTCNAKTVFPGNGQNIRLSVQYKPSVPVPGETMTVTASTANQDVKLGFLNFDWYVNGKQVVSGAKGQSTLTLTSDQTKAFQPGTYVTVRVVATNTNETQTTFGQTSEDTENILMGLPYDSLAVYQGDDLIYPSAKKSDRSLGPIHINRFKDVKISLANVWSNNSATNHLYFEWMAGGIVQTAKAEGRGSGTGSAYTTFTFSPKDFLPTNTSDSRLVSKTLDVLGRAVDLQSQKEVLRVLLSFRYDNPSVSVSQSVSSNQNAVVITAEPQNVDTSTALTYSWKVDGKPVQTDGKSASISLPLLQASVGKVVEVSVVSPASKTLQPMTGQIQLALESLRLPWQKYFAFKLWGMAQDAPRALVFVLEFFALLNVVFFVFYSASHAVRKRVRA